MSDLFDQLAPKLLSVEGGYVNDPHDSGGETHHGVTVATARAAGYHGPMRAMTKATALSIYRSLYWSKPGFDRVADISPDVAAELFDTGVNCGTSVPGPFLQRCLNLLNQGGSAWPDLAVDGVLGPKSREALEALLQMRGEAGETVLLKMLNCLQGARYIDIAERRPKDERYVYGWFRTRVGLPA